MQTTSTHERSIARELFVALSAEETSPIKPALDLNQWHGNSSACNL